MKFLLATFFVMIIDPANSQNPVVIELFTSQGCSSCPAADKYLAEIIDRAEKNGEQVYGLSFHVDYWNYIGWKDPYSKSEFTDRQKKYATLLNTESIYTPQMIVDGRTEFIGSDKRASNEEINKAAGRIKQFKIQFKDVQHSGTQITVAYALDKVPSDQVINLALVEKSVSNNVSNGENSGRKLSHRNVVRTFNSMPAKKEGIIAIPAWKETKDYSLILFLQNRQWEVTGASAKIF